MELEVPESVKAFNFWTLWIMARLWDDFPVPQHFDARRETIQAASDWREAGVQLTPPELPPGQLFASTLDWLLAEGFVTGTTNGAGMYAMVRLTTKGFAVLNETPHSVAGRPENKPLGTLMREAIVSNGVGLIAGLIQAMLIPPGSR